MTISAAEQYMLELINRARLDPAAEALRLGITLNQGLAANTLGEQVRQVLAPSESLELAAIAHSKWMLDTDVFSHTGAGGTSPGQRATAVGYAWNRAGENIAWQGSTAAISENVMIAAHHDALFRSASHRVNLLQDTYREVGIGQELGQFKQGAYNFNASMVGQLFGVSGNAAFVTGVAYNDTNADRFYSIGEGRAGVTFAAQGVSDTTEAPGGYAIKLAASAAVAITGSVGDMAFSATVGLDKGNVKLDVVDGKTFYSSGDITLGTGINDVRLIGMASMKATGNDTNNVINGNKGASILDGAGGNDYITGGRGADQIFGGTGNDSVYGGSGADTINGGDGDDFIFGGLGADRLTGGAGGDVITGGTELDTFIFQNGCGRDSVADYSLRSREVLLFDDALWEGRVLNESQVVAQFGRVIAGNVVFDFGAGDVVTLTGIRSLSGIASMIDII